MAQGATDGKPEPEDGAFSPGQRARFTRKQRSRDGDADLDGLRDICRCGTCSRIREAVKAAAAIM